MYCLEFETQFGLFCIIHDSYFVYRSFFKDRYYKDKLIYNSDVLIRLNRSTINNEIILRCQLIGDILNFVNQYFYLGKLVSFDILKLNLSYKTEFQLNIINTFHSIPYGCTLSYKEIGVLNNSNAYRAIGNICANNKFVILIPCHRIIRNNNSIGKYIYGTNVKESIIKYENKNKCISY